MGYNLNIATPRWCVPLLPPARYKGAKGGRGSGKSHFFAELLVELLVVNPNISAVCIREIQKSLKFSAKKLIEGKIRKLGVSHLFDINLNEIRRIGGDGIIIFQGMQDHTADSIKSLEGFQVAWAEEAQSLSARSMELLLPTIRAEGSEIWFSWNPNDESDAVDQLMCGDKKDPDAVCVHVNFTDNPFCPAELIKEAEKHRLRNPETYDHVWLGGYRDNSDARIMGSNWRVADFTPGADWAGPYCGLDFGFANDPTAAIQCYTHAGRLWLYKEAGSVGLELDGTADYIEKRIPGYCSHAVRADCSRPESISYLSRVRRDKNDDGSTPKHMPRIEGVKKGAGSVEDGIAFIKSFDEVVIHPSCTQTSEEWRKYSYKIDKATGDIMPVIVDAWNHYIDAVRYAIEPLMRASSYTLDNL